MRNDNQKRPGVMLYFDIRPSLKRLSLEEKGRLFDAVLGYGENGEIPGFDGVLGVVWDFIQPQIDRDAERYRAVSETRRNAANARWGKNANAPAGMQMMPTTTTTPSPTTTPSTSTSTAPSPSTKEEAAGYFERFWQAYPRQVGREAAMKAFAKVPKTAYPLILPAIEKQKKSRQWQEEGGRYIPNPARWLSEARWNDRVQLDAVAAVSSDMPTAQEMERMKRLRGGLRAEATGGSACNG